MWKVWRDLCQSKKQQLIRCRNHGGKRRRDLNWQKFLTSNRFFLFKSSTRQCVNLNTLKTADVIYWCVCVDVKKFECFSLPSKKLEVSFNLKSLKQKGRWTSKWWNFFMIKLALEHAGLDDKQAIYLVVISCTIYTKIDFTGRRLSSQKLTDELLKRI